MYIGQAKHPIFNGGTFGILSAESPEHPVHVQGGNPAMASTMDQMGLPFEPTTGKYTNPENSFVVHGATVEQLHSLAKQFGQTAFIHSEGGRHRFHYANGPNEGKWHEADEQNPVEHFEQPPPDMYTTVPGGHGHFRIAFKWDKLHGNDVAKSYSVEEAIALLLKSTGKLVKTLPALAAPALHPTVEGFMGGFRALPKDGPTRGKFITQHMNHGPFLSALQAHPQGKQIHSQLTSFLNSRVNAGPGKAVATVKSMLEKSDLTANVAALRAESQYKPHPHNYEWHDGHTSHHEVVDHAMPGLPGLAKSLPQTIGEDLNESEAKKLAKWWNANHKDTHEVRPHDNKLPAAGKKRFKVVRLSKTELAKNDQAAGAGVSTYARYAVPFGNVVPGKQSNLLHYDYHQKLPDVEKLVHDHGYKTYYAGGKYGKPDLANKNYNTGHLMVYDPTPASGGDFGHETYTKAWRQIHELAHALTYPELNKTYGEGRRIGKLGVHRSLHEALRAVHWEHLAAHKQRELSAQIGVPLTDEQFHKEYNTVMHDAIHRAVTGKFTEPGAEGFVPHGRAIPLHHSLQMVRDAANEMGLNGLHQKLTKALPPHPDLLVTADALQEQGFKPTKGYATKAGLGTSKNTVPLATPEQGLPARNHGEMLGSYVLHRVPTPGMSNAIEDAAISRYGTPEEGVVRPGRAGPGVEGNMRFDPKTDKVAERQFWDKVTNEDYPDGRRTTLGIAAPDREAWARSPIMRMKKSELAKTWPKDETENLDNAKGFLNSPVAQDAFLEQKPATFQEAPEAHSMPDRSKVEPDATVAEWNQCRSCGDNWEMDDPEETLCPACQEEISEWTNASADRDHSHMADTAEPSTSWGHQPFGQNPVDDQNADRAYWRKINAFTNTIAAAGGDVKATSAAQIPTQKKMLATAKRSPVFRHQAEKWKLGKNEDLSKARPPHEDLLVTADALQEQGFKPTPGFATKQGLGTRLNSIPLAKPEGGLPNKRHGESYDPYTTRVAWEMPEGGADAADRITEAAQSRYDNPTGAVPETTFGPREPGQMYHQTFTSGDRVNDKKYWQRMGTEPALNPTLGIAAPDREAWARSPIMRMKKSDLMPGGKGDGKSDTAFDHEELAAGIRAEASEHGLDLARAKEVAKDHLTEDPKYYSKLRTMEKAK